MGDGDYLHLIAVSPYLLNQFVIFLFVSNCSFKDLAQLQFYYFVQASNQDFSIWATSKSL